MFTGVIVRITCSTYRYTPVTSCHHVKGEVPHTGCDDQLEVFKAINPGLCQRCALTHANQYIKRI